MTAVYAFFSGAALMGIVWWLRRGNERTKWLLRGQEQAELTHSWHPPVSGEASVHVELRRFRIEQDLQPPPAPARPVFYDPR